MVQLERVCETGLLTVGYELVDLEYVREPGGWVLRLFIDHPFAVSPEQTPGGAEGLPKSTIDLHDCEVASRHLGTVLDVEDPIEGQYRLEVSSPGVRRRLRKERDFVRFAGNVARITMNEPVAGRKNFTGKLCSAGEGVVTLEANGERHELPIDGIKKARLEVEL